MRKSLLSIVTLCSLGLTAQAQLSDGGLPLSIQSAATANQYVPVNQFLLPDWESAKQKAELDEATGISKPYLVALPVDADMRFPSAGSLITLPNGSKVWKAQIRIDQAPAIGFNYDQFTLPEGVSMYLSNGNGQQVLGAYTNKNNSEDGRFANEPVQGGLVTIELNIEPNVNLSDIKLHVYKMYVYFRSYEYLNQYAAEGSTQARPTAEPDPFDFEGSSSTCGINAICPLGINYPNQRKATVQYVSFGGVCSATMINNTGNTTANCKQYVLTATHCDPNNNTSNSDFTELLIRFSFEKAQCTGGAAATVNTMQGANFRARANYINTSTPEINGDFMLLELRSAIPASWDAYLSGWNRATTMPSPISYPKRYIGFHHPGGDVKKVSVSNDIDPNGEAGGTMGPGTHWQIFPVDSGGIEGGSSGSGLFDGDGRLIGIASVAGAPDVACDETGKGDDANFFKFVAYSKFSLGWDYALDGNANMRKLKPWLDPANTGVITLDAVKSNCAAVPPPVTGVTNKGNSAFDNSISLYPNPTTNGVVTAKVNFKQATNLKVEIFNITGAKLHTYDVKNSISGAYTFDLGQYANGMYLIKFSDDNNNSTSKKVMLTK